MSASDNSNANHDELKGTEWEPIVAELLGLTKRADRLEACLEEYERRKQAEQ